ncbi:unnamed protein product [Lampetra fluviatilis]
MMMLMMMMMLLLQNRGSRCRVFFATGSDSETESSSSREELVTSNKPSASYKQFEELNNIIKAIRNAMKIRDMTRCLEEFEHMGRAYLKARAIVDKEGVPRFYARILADMEDCVSEVWEDKEGRKKMSKINSKALISLRQKLRRYSRDFETEIANHRKNPVQSDEEGDSDDAGSGDDDESGGSSSDSGGGGPASFLKKLPPTVGGEGVATVGGGADPKSKFLKGDGDDDDSDSDDGDWGSSDAESDSESSDGEGTAAMTMAERFLKRDGDKKSLKKKVKEKRPRHHRDEEEGGGPGDEGEGPGAGGGDEGGWEQVKGGVPMEKPKMFAKGTEITHAVVLKKLNEILQARGKKGTDRAGQIELLTELASISEQHNLGSALLVKIKFSLITAFFNYSNSLATCMKQDMWNRCLDNLEELMETIFSNHNIRHTIVIGEHIPEEAETTNTNTTTTAGTTTSSTEILPLRVRGCILSLVERMDEEFTKIMQNADAHSQEYVDHLKDEGRVCLSMI